MPLSPARYAALVALGLLIACDDPYPVPRDVAAARADAPYPALVPVERILAAVPPAAVSPAEESAAIETRAARLRARAAGLGGPVIDPGTDARMRRGIDR